MFHTKTIDQLVSIEVKSSKDQTTGLAAPKMKETSTKPHRIQLE
jgi:hypothetical protein